MMVKWRQAHYTWRRDGCRIETGYHTYDYALEEKPTAVMIWNLPQRISP